MDVEKAASRPCLPPSASRENDCEAIGGLGGCYNARWVGCGEHVGFLTIRIRRIASAKFLTSFLLASTFATTLWIPPVPAVAEKQIASPREFSGTLIKQVNGKKHQAQVFAKGDRFRLEYKYAIRTDYGYAAIEIIRLDLAEAWYLLAQQKELLVTPLDPDDVLPMQPTLPGERGRTLVGEATAVGRRRTVI